MLGPGSNTPLDWMHGLIQVHLYPKAGINYACEGLQQPSH